MEGRFASILLNTVNSCSKRPSIPPQSIKSNNVILSEAKDLIALSINWLW